MKNRLFFLMFLFASASACSDLGGAKGTVMDVLTQKPIGGIKIVAVTDTNIESEQTYRNVTTTTDSDGSFTVKGIRKKHYQLTFNKEGYTSAGSGVSIPEKSNALIQEPIKMCPLPPDGPGFYAYTDRPVKLPSKPFNRIIVKALREHWPSSESPIVYYQQAELKDVPRVRATRLISYHTNARHMFRLWRHTSLDNANRTSEPDGDYYCTTVTGTTFAIKWGTFLLGDTRKTLKITGDTHPDHYWGEVPRIFSYYGPATGNRGLQVFDVTGVPPGYYFLAEYIYNPDVKMPFSNTFVFYLDQQ